MRKYIIFSGFNLNLKTVRVWWHRLLLMIAATLFMSANASATIIADARGDFAPGVNIGDPGILPATGTGTWNYLASDTLNPTLDGTLDVLDWDIGNNSYNAFTTGGSANAVDLQSPGLASDEIRMHPSASGRPPTYAVSRWISGVGEAGLINITGNVRKVDSANGGGGGVTFDIFVDGTHLFNSIVNDIVGVAFNHTLTVGVGSTVDFVVGSNGGDSFDSTGLKAMISQVPEPSTLAIMSLGLFGLGFNRRKRLE